MAQQNGHIHSSKLEASSPPGFCRSGAALEELTRFDYEQALATFRMLADIRFKLLALVPFISGAGIAFLTADPMHVSDAVILAISLMGFVVTIGLTIYNIRNTQLMETTRYRAQELERLMMFPVGGQFERSPQRIACFGIVPIWADAGLALIYGTVLAAWVFLILHMALPLCQLDPIFGWPADTGAALVAILAAPALVWQLLRLSKCASNSAKEAVSSIVAERETARSVVSLWEASSEN